MNYNMEIDIFIIKNILNNIIDEICEKSKILEKQNQIDKQNQILEQECLICFESINKNSDTILFECFHKYHAKCINDWTLFEENNNNQFIKMCLLCKTSNFIIIPKRKIKKKVTFIGNNEIKLNDNKIKDNIVQRTKINEKKDTSADLVCSRRCIIC